MPVQKPGKSEQTVGTPAAFLDAVEARWGALAVDLAATDKNAVSPLFYGEDRDSLAQPWHTLSGTLWLNPPYAHIRPWAAKCQSESRLGARICFLVPASVGSGWYWDHVHGSARVCVLSPRLTFEGHEHPYPKDLILAVYGDGPGFERWLWREAKAA